jgi:hypothetical protein
MESLIFLLMFVAGFGSGFYVRHRMIANEQRSRYSERARIQSVSARRYPTPDASDELALPQPTEPIRDQGKAAPTPLDNKEIRTSDELLDLLKRLSPN